MSSLGVSTTVEQDDRHSSLIFRVVTRRRLFGLTLHTRATELQATPEGLTATGYLGGHQPGVLRLSWSRIRELHFAPAGAGETGGLYAREGTRCSRCILPHITERQARTFIHVLASRFPVLTRSVEMNLEPLAEATPNCPLQNPPTLLKRELPANSQGFFALSYFEPAIQGIRGREHEFARCIH